MRVIKDALARQENGAEKGRMDWGMRMEWTTVTASRQGESLQYLCICHHYINNSPVELKSNNVD